MVLAGALLQAAKEVALDSSRADSFAPPQTAPIDAVQVLLEDHFLEALTGALEGLNPGDLLAKPAAAVQTPALAEFQAQHALAKTPVIVPDRPPAPALVSQARTVAVRARYRPGMPGRYRYPATGSLYRGNLVLGQT